MITLTPRDERKNVKTIVLQLEKLLGDALDAVPRLGPTLGTGRPEDRGTPNLRANVAENSTIHERGPTTPKAWRHNDDRLDMVFTKMFPNLSGSMETDGLSFGYQDRLPIFQTGVSGHQFGDTHAHRIGYLWITRSYDRDECPWGEFRLLERRGAFEQEVVRIEVLDQDRVARGDVFHADQASPDLGKPASARRDRSQEYYDERSDAERPRRPD